MRILITGGAGFVGSNLAKKLSENDKNLVVVLDSLLTGNINNIPVRENLKFIKADVNIYDEIQPVMCSYHFDYVFHYAAVVGVKRTLDNPAQVLNDLNGIKNILHLSKSTGVKRVFYSSSSEVYGEPVELPQNEHTTPLNSRLPYAIVKNAGEAFCKSYFQEFGLEYNIFRFFNTYGVNQSKDFVMAKFISASLKNEDITIYGDGGQTRTFCYIDDNVDACIKIMESEELKNQTFNIGSDKEISILQLANSIIKISGSLSKVKHLPPLKEGDMTRRLPDNTQMKQILGRPLLDYEEGISKILNMKESLKSI